MTVEPPYRCERVNNHDLNLNQLFFTKSKHNQTAEECKGKPCSCDIKYQESLMQFFVHRMTCLLI